MPELPEVETVRRGLERFIVGKTVRSVQCLNSPKSFPNSPADVAQFLVGAEVTAVKRRAKVLLIELSTGYTLVTHLKMTGQLVYVGKSTLASSLRTAPSRPLSRAAPLLSSQIPSESARKSLAAGPASRSAPSFEKSGIFSKAGAAPPAVTRLSADAGSERRPAVAIADFLETEPNEAPGTTARPGLRAGGDGKGWDGAVLEDDRSGEVRDAVVLNNEIGGEQRFGGGHPNDDLINELPGRFTRVVTEFTDGSHLYFNDLRKFGWMKLYPTVEVPNINFMQRVGPEPLEDSFTATEFTPRIRRRNNTSIKAAILDQTVLAGVGNIYADESLWGAKIHPATRARSITDTQLATLLEQIKFVMNLSLQHGGSTDKNYVDAEGNKGSYLKFANVFRREGQICPRHPGVLIEKIRVAGRGTHICPVCQVEAV